MPHSNQNPWYQRYVKNPVVSMLGGTLHTIGLWNEILISTSWQAVTTLSQVPLTLESFFMYTNKNKGVLDWGFGKITTASMLLFRETLKYMQVDNTNNTVNFTTICPNNVPTTVPTMTLPPLPPIGYQTWDIETSSLKIKPEQLYSDMIQLVGIGIVSFSYSIGCFTVILKNCNVISYNSERKVKKILKYVTLGGWIAKSSGLIMENNYVSGGLHLSASVINFINDFEIQTLVSIGNLKLEISCNKPYGNNNPQFPINLSSSYDSINSQSICSLKTYNHNFNLDINGKLDVKDLKTLVAILNKKETIVNINFEKKIGNTEIEIFPTNKIVTLDDNQDSNITCYNDVNININYQDNKMTAAIVDYLNSLAPESITLKINDKEEIELKLPFKSWLQCFEDIEKINSLENLEKKPVLSLLCVY